MNMRIWRQFPIPVPDLESVSSMLRDRKVLCGVLNPSADWYDPMWYTHDQALDQMTFTLLLDRNVYSFITELADGDARVYTDSHRLGAAVLCFADCCDLRTESIIAVLERELDSADPRFAVEHPKFLRVLTADPTCLADFALGRSETLTLEASSISPPAEFPTLSESNRPDPWTLNFGCALKLASLILDDGMTHNADRFLAYLQWCYDEFFFSMGATASGSLAMPPRRKPDMFKRLKGKSVQKAMHGIRNAAWDMTLISEWELRQHELSETKNYHLICSLDQAIMDVAAWIMSQEKDAGLRREQLRNSFLSNWNAAGDKLFSAYETMCSTVHNDLKRPANQGRPRSHWDAKINGLQAQVTKAITDRSGS